MRRMHQTSALAGILVAVLLVSLAPAEAQAGRPVKESSSASGSNPFYAADGTEVQCGGDTVMIDWVLRSTTTTRYDATHQILRQTQHAQTEETWYLQSNPTRTLRGATNYEVETLTPGVGLYQGLEMWTGVFWKVFAPGVGTVLLDAGLEIIDWRLLPASPVVKAVGKHQWLDSDFDKLCAALQ